MLRSRASTAEAARERIERAMAIGGMGGKAGSLG
jgi:hypothetical protein